MRYAKKYAIDMLDAYTDELRYIQENVNKNFDDMDFENADTRDDMQEIILELQMYCLDLVNEVEQKEFLLREV